MSNYYPSGGYNYQPPRRRCYDEHFDPKRHPFNDDGTKKTLEDLELWKKRLFRKIKEAIEDDPSSLFVEKKTKFYDELKEYIEKERIAQGSDPSVSAKRNREWLEREAYENGEGYATFKESLEREKTDLRCNESISGKENDIPPPKKRTPSEWENKKI